MPEAEMTYPLVVIEAEGGLTRDIHSFPGNGYPTTIVVDWDDVNDYGGEWVLEDLLERLSMSLEGRDIPPDFDVMQKLEKRRKELEELEERP